ncbi:MAG: GGDEF domain-containing protein, partial [Methylococcaceae bacterium]
VGVVFEHDENIPSLAVIDPEGYPISLILRADFMNILASRYGRELFARKPISEFIKRKALIMDHETRLEEVSRSITNSSDYYTEEFIITSQGIAIGKALLLDLLSAITDLQITRARYANPLTLLPGNVVIQQKMDELVQAREPFIVAYCDLDNFKAYNDVYGYLRGDELIRLTGRLLGEVCDDHFDFIGHIGGDDFIVLFKSQDWRERCDNLLSKMEQIIPNYYSDADKLRGGIVTVDRYGATREFPFVSLSIGALAIDKNYEQINMDSIAETATDAKKSAKKTPGNSFYLVKNT